MIIVELYKQYLSNLICITNSNSLTYLDNNPFMPCFFEYSFVIEKGDTPESKKPAKIIIAGIVHGWK